MSSPHTFRRSALLATLNAEWDWLVERERPSHWEAEAPRLGSCVDLDQVLALIRLSPDETLGTLLALCAAGDQLAGRTVLQAMLGKLVRFSRTARDASLGDYVGAMWLRIRTYPLAERPNRIAANLALDTLKAVRRASSLPLGVEISPCPPETFVELIDRIPPSVAEVGARPLLEAAARLGVITGDTSAVLTSVYVDGLSGAAASSRHGKSAGAIRVQCHTAVRRLARQAPALLDAA